MAAKPLHEPLSPFLFESFPIFEAFAETMDLTRIVSLGLFVTILSFVGCGGGGGENTVDATPSVQLSEDDPNYHGEQNNN